jgi:hypothetical protein
MTITVPPPNAKRQKAASHGVLSPKVSPDTKDSLKAGSPTKAKPATPMEKSSSPIKVIKPKSPKGKPNTAVPKANSASQQESPKVVIASPKPKVTTPKVKNLAPKVQSASPIKSGLGSGKEKLSTTASPKKAALASKPKPTSPIAVKAPIHGQAVVVGEAKSKGSKRKATTEKTPLSPKRARLSGDDSDATPKAKKAKNLPTEQPLSPTKPKSPTKSRTPTKQRTSAASTSIEVVESPALKSPATALKKERNPRKPSKKAQATLDNKATSNKDLITAKIAQGSVTPSSPTTLTKSKPSTKGKTAASPSAKPSPVTRNSPKKGISSQVVSVKPDLEVLALNSSKAIKKQRRNKKSIALPSTMHDGILADLGNSDVPPIGKLQDIHSSLQARLEMLKKIKLAQEQSLKLANEIGAMQRDYQSKTN